MAVLSAGRRNHNVDQRRSKMSVEPALKKLEEDALDLQGMRGILLAYGLGRNGR